MKNDSDSRPRRLIALFICGVITVVAHRSASPHLATNRSALSWMATYVQARL